jgi:hypothetical protein
MTRREQRLVNALRFILVCRQAYHSQGPTVILQNMEDAARMALQQHEKDRARYVKTE